MMSKKVNFVLPCEVVASATSGIILGEFNNWDDKKATSLKKQKDGSMKATLALEAGKTYQYRYLLNDGRWVNDDTADQFIPASGYNVENCVITVPVASEEVIVKSAKKDDLTKIDGIGKKIAELLSAGEINSFEELAKATPKKIRAILDAAGNKFKAHSPETWPKQARLAATGKWQELKKFRAELMPGK